VAIALGATSMTDITLLAQHAPVLGAEPSDTTVRRTLELADLRTLDKVARVRAAVRTHVWSLIAATPAGFPWLSVAGKLLAGWLVIDLDGTLITAHSEKQGAAPTFKKGYGFHPLGAWLANTAESLAMLLRPGNAGSNTFTDHAAVLGAAIRQIPSRMRSRLLVRVDGAGASHELITHLLSLSSRRRTVLFTCGWMITQADEQAIWLLPATAWQAAVDQDGAVQAAALGIPTQARPNQAIRKPGGAARLDFPIPFQPGPLAPQSSGHVAPQPSARPRPTPNAPTHAGPGR
jgi:Transposase DDE domain group 1